MADTEFQLPAFFDIAKAASIIGMAKAQSLLDEVTLVAVGNLDGFRDIKLPLRGLEIAARDDQNSQQHIAKAAVERIVKILDDAKSAKTAADAEAAKAAKTDEQPEIKGKK